jgi:hypothetical protein
VFPPEVVTTGAGFNAVTVTILVAVLLFTAPSFVVKLIVRLEVFGIIAVLFYSILLKAVW